MKCPKCAQNHLHKYGMRCSCGYRFALDPKTDGMSDRRFISFINGASCNGTYFFTEKQLYTAACRKQYHIHGGFLIVVPILAVIFLCLGLTWTPFMLVFSAGLAAISLVFFYYFFLARLRIDRFEGWLKKYNNAHGPIDLLIKETRLLDPPKQESEPDIHDYGVERVLIVQRPILVDLLIANKIHATNRSIIVTADGYPSYLAKRVQKLLDESPELPVFLLHDSDYNGISWAADQMAHYQAPKRPVVDLGLAPESMKKIRKLRTLRLKKSEYKAPIDVLPMAMLANGIALSMERGIGMEELLVLETTTDASASFG